MGVHLGNMSHSQRLEDTVKTLQKGFDVGDLVDLCSSSGYDNYGSTGPELIDNGVGLGLRCAAYDKDAQVFFAYVDDLSFDEDGEEEEDASGTTVYYQFGKDEEDAVRRLLAAAS